MKNNLSEMGSNTTRLNEMIRREVNYQIQTMKLNETNIDRQLMSAFNILESDVKRYEYKQTRLNEGIDSIIGLWLSGPYIVKLFGKFVNYLNDVVKKFNKKGFGGDVLAQKIIQFADRYHHKVMWIFEKVAGKFTKDPKRIEQIAELLFTAVIGGLLAFSVGGIVKTVKSLTFDSSTIVQTMKAAVKSKELMKGVQLAIEEIIPEITAIARVGLRAGANVGTKV